MSVLRCVWRELAFRRSRSLINVLSFAVAVLAAVLLTALAASYARAMRAPIETVGADVIVQITGDIPPKLEGLVFPHPNALVPAAAVAAVRAMAGVSSVTRAVYMWELAPDHYQSILGIDDSEAGLGSLASRLIDGKPLGAGACWPRPVRPSAKPSTGCSRNSPIRPAPESFRRRNSPRRSA